MQRKVLAVALAASLLLIAACGDERADDVTTSAWLPAPPTVWP